MRQGRMNESWMEYSLPYPCSWAFCCRQAGTVCRQTMELSCRADNSEQFQHSILVIAEAACKAKSSTLSHTL